MKKYVLFVLLLLAFLVLPVAAVTSDQPVNSLTKTTSLLARDLVVCPTGIFEGVALKAYSIPLEIAIDNNLDEETIYYNCMGIVSKQNEGVKLRKRFGHPAVLGII